MSSRKRSPGNDPGQLTLEEALDCAVKSETIPETDSDEPDFPGCFSSSEVDNSADEYWRPKARRRRVVHDSESDSGDDEEDSQPRRARIDSSDGEEETESGPMSSAAGPSRGRKSGDGGPMCSDPPCWLDDKEWSPKDIPFSAVPGPRGAAAALNSDSPVDFLELFLCEELLQHIVDQTNLYAEQCLVALAELRQPYSRVNSWNPLTVMELKIFLGLFFNTGLVWKTSLASYWSTDEPTSTPFFTKTMSRNRYQLIWRFLHFNNNQEVDGSDRLYKVRPVLDMLVAKFKEMYQPAENISIDEGMLLWRGRLKFRVYSPAKPVKYKIKSYILCDSATGYCFSMKPYCGSHSSLEDTVLFLIDGLKGFGYRLWMDNYYNSESLCRLLLGLGIHTAGTLRSINIGEPPSIRDVKLSDLAVGETMSRHNEDVMVLAWRDKRIVRMITTFHQDEMKSVEVKQKGQSEKVLQKKPACVVEYNKYMSGVDRLDQKISFYPWVRKTAKWSSKFVAYLFQITMVNAYILYKAKTRSGSCKNLKEFILAVVTKWTRAPPFGPHAGTSRRPRNGSSDGRMDVDFAGHEMVPIRPTSKRKPFRKCIYCKYKGLRKETQFVCPGCQNTPLCLYPCYFKYHSTQ